MKYDKPEITLLGEATSLILGAKGSPEPDNASLSDLQNPSDHQLQE
jgi:hypothetical protein